MTHVLRQCRSNTLLAAVAFCALFLRIVIPAGFMPTFGDGGMTITICTSQGFETLAVDADGNPVHQPAGQEAGKPCAMSGLGFMGISAVPTAIAAVAIAFILLTGLKPASAPRPAIGTRIRPPLRAPPRIAVVR